MSDIEQNVVAQPSVNLEHDAEMEHRETVQPVIQALREDRYDDAKELLDERHSSDVAEILSLVDKSERAILISILGRGKVEADILTELDSEAKEDVLNLIGAKNSANAIKTLESDDVIQLVEDLPDKQIEEILGELSGKHKKELEEALTYPEDSAGRLANKQFVTIKHDFTVGDCIDLLRTSRSLPEDFYTMFVINEDNKPTHFVPLSRVIRNKRTVKITKLMEEVKKAIDVDTDQEDVASTFQKYSLISAPVVDHDGHIIGVITIDDIASVIEEEVEEDIMQLAGVGNDTDILSSPVRKFKKRSPWLFVNIITSLLASLVISMFEVAIQELVALAVLMPIVASMSGSAGSQTLTVAVRAIATRELSFLNYLSVMKKEMLTALANGLLFGLITFVAALVIYGNLQLGIVIFVSIVTTFALAVICGLTIPLIMNKYGFDPAVSSTALVYAITDLSSFFIFLGLASVILL